MKVSQEVMEVLERSRVEGCTLSLPPGNLDRKLYTAVNDVIEAAGGKWVRGKKCHVFESDAADTLDPILLTGEYTLTKQDFGQFDTPADLAQRVVIKAGIRPGMKVLEPSVGIGRIASKAEKAGGHVTAYEVDAKRLKIAMDMCELAGGAKLANFLDEKPTPIFDVVVMNPPFSKQADIAHVLHAAKFLKPGGQLVAIMSASVTFRTNAKTESFRDFLHEHNGGHTVLPDGSFKESGTLVNAVMVWLTAN